MDSMEQMKVVGNDVEAASFQTVLYSEGYESYLVVRDSGEIEVRWNEYE